MYYVSVNGSDTNSGSEGEPWRTIQKCLDQVQAGETCEILGGTYNESLVLRRSGTENARITLRNHAGQTVTVNSGNGKSLMTGGRVHFYTIEGLRFVASYIARDLWDYTLNFGSNVWDGETDRNGGNNGFILRNCYVEGAVQFYGHNNLVENCELNGKNNWSNGVVDHFAASHDNIYRNNNVHDYKVRGIWSMQYTDNIVIEGNTVHHNGEQGIDCDGAANPVYRCYVRNNIIHDIGTAGVGILMENAFDSIVDGNRVSGLVTGIEVISYGPGIAAVEYRTTDTNIVIRNNLVYDTGQDGIICYGSPGGKVLNNTIYNTNLRRSWFGAIALTSYEGYYCHNWEIKNNLITQTQGAALWIEAPSAGLNNFTSDCNLIDINLEEAAYLWRTWIGASYTDTLYNMAKMQSLKQLELYSITSNALLEDVYGSNFHLKSNSPAINFGCDLGLLNPSDFDGNVRPQGTGFDIGAFELPVP